MIRRLPGSRTKESRAYYLKNKEMILAKQKEYYQAHTEAIHQRDRAYYQDHKAEISAKPYTEEKRAARKVYYRKNTVAIRSKHRAWEEKNGPRIWAWATIHKHQKRGYDVRVSAAELDAMMRASSLCPYCGVQLVFRGKQLGGMRESASLDRKDNEKTLTKDNVQIICLRCNGTKHDRTHDEFLDYCRMIADRFSKEEAHDSPSAGLALTT